MTLVQRPVWRQFLPAFLPRAAAHVRSGGHAVVVHGEEHLDLLLPVNRHGEITELGEWSLLAIEHDRWTRVRSGVAKGLMTVRVSEDYVGSVLDWCDRDARHPGALRRIQLDCLACAACCHDGDIVLDPEDLRRFRGGGRDDLTRTPYVARTSEGRLRLRMLEGGRCRHLGDDRRCAIYALRPGSCRAFVVGSEACLSAREDTLGIRDE